MTRQSVATLVLDPSSADSRKLKRLLRNQPDSLGADQLLPESVLWQVWVELRRRGEQNVDQPFLRSVKNLHRRRSIGAVELPTQDPDPDEHKLVDDPFLGELWKAYKRCICAQRTGPAAQLLRDIEDRM